MNLYIGTSGYSYKQWKGPFYPEELSSKQMLSYYSSHFRSVEINNTFYRMPKVSVLEAWAREVPSYFRFALKAPQRITHLQRLVDSEESLDYLLEVSGALKERLGALLFQLPPYLRVDLPRLRNFLGLIPPDQRVAFEFRHQSWFDDELFALLKRHNAALCIAEAEGELKVPFISTADWGYLRLRRPDYDAADLKMWASRVRAQPWHDVFVYFKHEEEAMAPRLARRFLELVAPLNH